MPSWGILKAFKSKSKRRSSRKVRFSTDEDDQESRTSSNSLESDTSLESACSNSTPDVHDQPDLHRHQDLPVPGHVEHADISHSDIEDDEERKCLRHLDRLGLALEKTYKQVDSLDAYVRKLRFKFDHKNLSEKKFMSSMCSAKIARAAYCKRQIEVWHQLQHDIKETCCHHHPLSPNPSSHHHPHNHHHHHHHDLHHQGSETEADSSFDSSDSFSVSSSAGSSQDCAGSTTSCSAGGGSSDTGVDAHSTNILLQHVQKMVLFDVVRQRLDPSTTNARDFVAQWIMKLA